MKYNYFPHSVNASTNSQSIVFNFQNDTSNYVNKISFVGIETIQPTCEAISSVTLNCSAVFNKVGKYYFTIDGVYNGDIIYVRENYQNTQDTQDSQDTQDNKSKENSKSQQNENNENNNSNENSEKNNSSNNSNNKNNNINISDDSSQGNFIRNKKIISMLLILALLF